MVIKTVADINQYTGMSVNPMSNPEQIYELYSVPSFETRYPEIIKGSEIGSNKITVESGDILICKINPRINRVWVVEHNTEYPLLASSEWIVVRNSEIDSGYLKWYFSSPSFRTLLTSQVAGIGGSLTRAQPKQVATYPVPIPPCEQQQYIAAKLDKLDVLITLRKEQLAKLDQLVKSRFVELFECGDYPFYKLGDVCTKITDGTHKTPNYLDSGVTFISAKNIVNGELDFTDVKYISDQEYAEIQKRCQTEMGDILLSKSGSLGAPVIVKTADKIGLFESLAVIKYDRHRLLAAFLCEQLKSDNIQRQFKVGTKGVAIKHLHLGVIADTEIIVPPMEEQMAFVRFVEQSNKTKLTIQSSLDKLEIMKKALMQEYFG